MLEAEAGSLARLILAAAGDPVPYFGTVPQDFEVPGVYFPPPEVGDEPDTLNSYALEYVWFIKFFASSDQEAHALAMAAQRKILDGRRAVPLYTREGEDTGRKFRVAEAAVKPLDGHGVAQLTVRWVCRRDFVVRERERIKKLTVKVYTKRALEAMRDSIAGARKELKNE